MGLDYIHYQPGTTLFHSHVRAPQGIRNSRLLSEAPLKFDNRGQSRAQRDGKRYERKVLRYLSERFPFLLQSPWFGYEDQDGKSRYCQPDGLFVTSGSPRIIILEVKRRHTTDAWFQLRKLYEPVVRAAYQDIPTSVCEVTMNFDCTQPWPETVAFCSTPEDILALGPVFGVFQWRK